MEIFALVALSSMQSLSKIKINLHQVAKISHTCTCIYYGFAYYDICMCMSDLKCVHMCVYVCTRGAFGQGGGGCLKSMCQLCAYVCLHLSYIGGGGWVFLLSMSLFVTLKKPPSPHSK